MKSDVLPIYLLPGMSADYPVFSRLTPLLPNASVVNFIDPKPNESLPAYAERMAERFPSPCYIAGVSFGGILALEISRIVQPNGCILVSSVASPSELPPWFRVLRVFGGRYCSRILSGVGDSAALIPKHVRTASTMRATKFSGATGAWYRWATSAMLNWNPNPQPISSPLLHIHGDADTTFPIRYTNPNVVIANGRHALPISHPVDTANAIIDFTKAETATV